MHLTPGAVLKNGKYVLNAPLGQGVFGITYRATDTESGQSVVIKTLAQSLRQHPGFGRFKQQFLSDARRLALCKHPHLVRVLDCLDEAGCPYLVTEYIPGQTLAELVPEGQSLPVSQAVRYIFQIGNALRVLHSNGLLHQDIKPRNIIRRHGTNSVVLTEVGLVCNLTPGVRQTHAGLLSAGYAPVEQYLPQASRAPATDIYALAATFYCLLTGQPPEPAPVRLSLGTLQEFHTPVPELELLPSDLKQAIKHAVLYGLAIEPNQRPKTVEEWLSLLPVKQILAACTSKAARIQSTRLGQPSDTPKGSPKPSQGRFAGKTVQGATQRRSPARQLPKALMMTSAIAAFAGAGFGFALRFNSPTGPGSGLLHLEQSFPPREDWPGSDLPTRTSSAPDTSLSVQSSSYSQEERTF